jgi:hypothetical protein
MMTGLIVVGFPFTGRQGTNTPIWLQFFSVSRFTVNKYAQYAKSTALLRPHTTPWRA